MSCKRARLHKSTANWSNTPTAVLAHIFGYLTVEEAVSTLTVDRETYSNVTIDAPVLVIENLAWLNNGIVERILRKRHATLQRLVVGRGIMSRIRPTTLLFCNRVVDFEVDTEFADVCPTLFEFLVFASPRLQRLAITLHRWTGQNRDYSQQTWKKCLAHLTHNRLTSLDLTSSFITPGMLRDLAQHLAAHKQQLYKLRLVDVTGGYPAMETQLAFRALWQQCTCMTELQLMFPYMWSPTEVVDILEDFVRQTGACKSLQVLQFWDEPMATSDTPDPLPEDISRARAIIQQMSSLQKLCLPPWLSITEVFAPQWKLPPLRKLGMFLDQASLCTLKNQLLDLEELECFLYPFSISRPRPTLVDWADFMTNRKHGKLAQVHLPFNVDLARDACALPLLAEAAVPWFTCNIDCVSTVSVSTDIMPRLLKSLWAAHNLTVGDFGPTRFEWSWLPHLPRSLRILTVYSNLGCLPLESTMALATQCPLLAVINVARHGMTVPLQGALYWLRHLRHLNCVIRVTCTSVEDNNVLQDAIRAMNARTGRSVVWMDRT
jgi:hypothetical protein